MSGVSANRLSVATCDCEVSPRDVTDHVTASVRRGHPDVHLCSPQTVNTAWSLLATNGYSFQLCSLFEDGRFNTVDMLAIYWTLVRKGNNICTSENMKC